MYIGKFALIVTVYNNYCCIWVKGNRQLVKCKYESYFFIYLIRDYKTWKLLKIFLLDSFFNARISADLCSISQQLSMTLLWWCRNKIGINHKRVYPLVCYDTFRCLIDWWIWWNTIRDFFRDLPKRNSGLRYNIKWSFGPNLYGT